MSVAREQEERIVMVFGVFDGLHDGHVSFLNQARALGDRLITVIARDECVMRLKGHTPQRSLAERMDAIAASGLAHAAVPGDAAEGGWEVVRAHTPHVIAVGYDQHAMREHLEQSISSFPFPCEIVVMQPHEPERFHSSLRDRVSL